MSDSVVDRILIGQSIAGSGPLTRSLHESHTSGFIRDDATHWSIEPYIPLTPDSLIDLLIRRPEFNPERETEFRQFCDRFDRILDKGSASYRRRFASLYAPVDPDSDERRHPSHKCHPTSGTSGDNELAAEQRQDGQSEDGSSNESPSGTDQETEQGSTSPLNAKLQKRSRDVADLVDEMLITAGYRRLEQDEITNCVGVASQFGVPLHVDLEIFSQLSVYARGDIIGTRMRRSLRKLYRREEVSVQIYQRMVVIFQLRDDDPSDERLEAAALHIRMFKNIPKQDVDTLLPGTKVRISGFDRLRIIAPSLGGFLMSMRRIAQTIVLFAMITLHWSAIIVALMIGYLVKSVFSYFQTKNKYQLSLTRNLYFQKTDTNAGAVYHGIQQSHQQQVLEGILAQYALITSDQPLSRRRLRRRCERLMREAINVEIDFQVDRALKWLQQAGSIREVDDRWEPCQTTSPETSSQDATNEEAPSEQG